MRKDFSKAVLAEIVKRSEKKHSSHLYINIIRYNGGQWVPSWRTEYLASTDLSEAHEMRRKLIEHLRGPVNPKTGRIIRPFWTKDRVKTIKIF